jgi:hypothetical protein
VLLGIPLMMLIMRTFSMAKKSNVGAVALLATLLSGTAFAQAPNQAPPAGTPPASSSAIPPAATPPTEATTPLSERKMDQFVNAYVEVQTIQQSAASDLKTATPEKVEAVKQKAEGDMVAAVERSGLAIAEFNQIVQTMQVDEGVRSQISAKVQERLGKPTE